MAQIPKESIEQVLSATDIVDLINSYVPLKRAGAQFRANCPFHNEKTPSFYVNPARQSFHCFGCGKGGDAISFVRDYENLPFMEAVRKLAGRSGVQIREEESDPEADQKRKSKGRLLDVATANATIDEIASTMRDALLNWPARVAGVIAAVGEAKGPTPAGR